MQKRKKKTVKAKILGLFKAAFLRNLPEINRNVSGLLSRKAVVECLKEGKQKEDKKEK